MDLANKVQLKVKADKAEHSNVYRPNIPPDAIAINLRLVLPKKHVAQFTSRKFEFIDQKDNTRYEYEHFGKTWVPSKVSSDQYTQVDLLSKLHGNTEHYIFSNGVRIVIFEKWAKDYRDVRIDHRLYSFDFIFDVKITTDYVLRIPSILVAGIEHTIPEIRLTETTGTFILPLNC